MLSPILEATPVPELALPEVRKDESASESVPMAPVAAPSYDEPVVTRRELWSYYCVYPSLFAISLTASLQCINLGITYVSLVLLVVQSTGFGC